MRHLYIFFCLLAALPGFSQPPPEKVPGLPTNELHDLHVDKKGYLWIAHELGISRYDGMNFITYSHPAQASLQTTDIVEDSLGRIWFHNFSGQVFYIENGITHLLAGYDFKTQNQNPKMALCGNDLLISSHRGLFVCNTRDLQTRFFPFERTYPTRSVSLAVFSGQAVVYNSPDWYHYQANRLQKITSLSTLQIPDDDFVSLQRETSSDTLFLTANPSGSLYKLKWDEGKLHLLGKQEYHDYINTVSVGKEAWIHTRNQSTNLTNGTLIANADLTDIVSGKEGSTWYGSRREGLLVSYRPSLWKQVQFPIEKDDYIRSINANAGYFFAGTQRGTLYQFSSDNAKEEWKQELFNGLGSIDFIRYIGHDLFVVGSSTETYIVNAREKRLETTLPIKGVLDVDFDGSSFFIATTTGLYLAPYAAAVEDKTAWIQQKKSQFPFFTGDESKEAFLLFPQRTKSVRVDSLTAQLYAATKNGLYLLNRQGARPYLVDGKEVFATSLAFKKGRLYVATLNKGLWIMESKGTQQLTTANELGSNTIIRIKLTEDHLWLFEKNRVQVMDIHSNRLLTHLDLPRVEGANVLDVAEKGNFGYLTTSNGVYKLALHLAAPKLLPESFLDFVIVNGSDTLLRPAVHLRHSQNDVQFQFSSPSYYDPGGVTFHYRLQGAEDDWRVMPAGERTIHYAALTPGDYQFELFAVNSSGTQQTGMIRFPFTIEKPWWKTWWFFVLVNLLLVAAALAIIQSRIRQKLQVELIRRNISHDLHDDIGATLSSVNLYIDLARAEKENGDYLQQIKVNVNSAISHLDDLVWCINPKNDSTEQFIQRMKDFAIPLLKAARIQCRFEYEDRLLERRLHLQTKRHLYLLFKEMINNVTKHARCRNCTIQLGFHNGQLHLSVVDDGQGFELWKVTQTRNGLTSMRDRARLLKGEIEIQSTLKGGSRVAVKVPV